MATLISCFSIWEINPFSTTRRYKRHQYKVKVKGLGLNISYLAWFCIFFHGSMKKSNQVAREKGLWIYLSSIKTKVAIKFSEKNFFFSAENWLSAERVNQVAVFWKK